MLPPGSVPQRMWHWITIRLRTTPRPVAERPATVRIGNISNGGVLFWLAKLYAFAVGTILLLLVMIVVSIYAAVADATPEVPNLSRYAISAPAVTRAYAADGMLLGEFAEEWREVVAYDHIPAPLVQAFLAVEDHEFFEHDGIYFKGILRAAWKNIVAGDWVQGGSTITQQVAKQFLGSQKTLSRKAKEAIMARRLESRYSKEEILAVYLNQIYLGSGAYGVAAAAHRYFSKTLAQLTLAEMATIAGLAQAPSRDSPLVDPDRARRRRDVVLDKMVRYKFLSPADAERNKLLAVETHPPKSDFLQTSPYFAEHVRRELENKYGPRVCTRWRQWLWMRLCLDPSTSVSSKEGIMRRGLRVETTLLPWLDGIAQENVDFMARKQDKRQGYRGPEAHLSGAAKRTFSERANKMYGDEPLVEGRRYLALVERVGELRTSLRVGKKKYELKLADMDWATEWSRTDSLNDQLLETARGTFRPGDVIWVARRPSERRGFSDWYFDPGGNPRWHGRSKREVKESAVMLEQIPHPQAAIMTFDHQTGYVMAMIGGQDYARSEFNRATQACRQPGSTYKPIYYSTALDDGYSFETLLNDKPRAEVDPVTGEIWVPTNLHGTVDLQVTLEYALVFSKNVPSVDIFSKVGAKKVEKWARRLGFTSPIIADKALALGASCTYLDELSRAFAIFARNGKWLDLVYIRRITDREGNEIANRTAYYDSWQAPNDRLDRLANTSGRRPKQAIPARAAYLTTKLLREVVTDGLSASVRHTHIPTAGKTGTSSATMDLWFVGFTSRWLTTTWVGDDERVRPLGKHDAAYMTVVPLWARYMNRAAKLLPRDEVPTKVPRGVDKNDRGDGSKGELAEEKMKLAPHIRTKADVAPEGMPIKIRERPRTVPPEES